jgi:hypothetical protein
MFKQSLLVLSAFLAFKAHAETSYIDMLKSLTPDKKNVVSAIPEIEALSKATSIEGARQALNHKLFETSVTEAAPNLLPESAVMDLIKKRQVTFVIVPGVLGEFIDSRAFEEVFSKNSSFKSEWTKLADQAGSTDTRYSLEQNGQVTEKMSNLINAASVDDENGKPLYKIVILKTLLGSMESVGKNEEKAQIFNRRLQKYYQITHDPNIVLLGYSRGTPLALEMVVQATKNHLSFMTSVKSVVSYAGVIMGSALADVTDDPTAENGQLLIAARKLQSDLQTSDSILDRGQKLYDNGAAIAAFLKALSANAPAFDPNTFLTTARSGDFRTVAALIAQMSAQLGFESLLDFNGHVLRLKHFISEVLSAVEGLKSKSMQAWWKTHKLPAQLQYYSLTAAMVDPEKNETESEIFHSNEGYSDSLDDQSLLGNQRAYEKLTGVALNDSQVAVYQSLFLPKLIGSLNPQNAGLNMKPLALLETHHWGAALQVVNKMRDGRKNPFPREKVLLALAAYLNQ